WLALPGTASATLTTTFDNTNNAAVFTPAWTVAPNSLIAGLSPSSSAGGFTLESAGGTPKLTDGAIGPVGSGTGPFATAGNSSSAGHEVIYTLPANDYGYDVTNITVFSGWGDGGRDGQGFYVLYSTKVNPTTFLPLGSIARNDAYTVANHSANRAMFF